MFGTQLFAKPPSGSYYSTYLDSLNGSKSSHQESSDSLWQNYLDAAADSGSTAKKKRSDDDNSRASTSEPPLVNTTVVPSMFFREDFDLGNPLIWEGLSTSSILDALPIENATTIHLLSDHLDLLETRLVQEVSERAPMFFSALTNLQNLTSQAAACLAQIARLQNILEDLDSSIPRLGLLCSEAQYSLEQCRQTSFGLNAVQMAVDSVDLARRLGQNHDWTGALEALSELLHWHVLYDGQVHGENPAGSRGNTVREIGTGDSLPSLSDITEETDETLLTSSYMSPLIPARVPAAVMSLALASLPSIQAMFHGLEPLVAGMRNEIKINISEMFRTMLEHQHAPLEQNQSSAGEPHTRGLRFQPIFRAFHRCGGAFGEVVALWRVASMHAVREAMRKVSQFGSFVMNPISKPDHYSIYNLKKCCQRMTMIQPLSPRGE